MSDSGMISKCIALGVLAGAIGTADAQEEAREVRGRNAGPTLLLEMQVADDGSLTIDTRAAKYDVKQSLSADECFKWVEPCPFTADGGRKRERTPDDAGERDDEGPAAWIFRPRMDQDRKSLGFFIEGPANAEVNLKQSDDWSMELIRQRTRQGRTQWRVQLETGPEKTANVDDPRWPRQVQPNDHAPPDTGCWVKCRTTRSNEE